MIHTFTAETVLPRPRHEIFAFFSDAANLGAITPPELHFQILTASPVELHQGARIEYRLRLFGVRFGWTTEITEWEPPQRFVDVQLRGPYREWIHEHAFVEEGSVTRMRDTVRWSLPFQPVGELAYPFVRFQIGRIFRFRGQVMRRFFAP